MSRLKMNNLRLVFRILQMDKNNKKYGLFCGSNKKSEIKYAVYLNHDSPGLKYAEF